MMGARDNYPYLTGLGFPAEQQAEEAFAEIDQLRQVNKFLREVLDDVLPTIVLTDTSFVKIDGHWIRITMEPLEPAGPLQARATIVT